MVEYRMRQMPYDAQMVETLERELGVTAQTAQLLCMRGVGDPQAARAFLHPSAKQLHDPFLLRDMEKAVLRIREALEKRERIVVYGDYDVDGVTSASILKLHLQKLGADVDVYLPHRHTEGYGLNCASVEKLAADHTLLLTCDCGITSAEEVRLAKALGLDTIITDHHELGENVPECVAVVNPKLGVYPQKELCGAGVALKLVQALSGLDAALEYIDLAAVGTVSDIVPLLGENRTIVALGLERINKKPRVGLEALCRVAGIVGKRVTAGHIAFALGPRINASGRMGHSLRSVEMLTTENRALADAIATEINLENERRQKQEQEILLEAERQIEEEMDFQKQRVIIVVGEGWNAGVIGIVASRIVEHWNWPTIVFSREGERCVGSARSIPGVHLYNALYTVRDVFTRFGGHAMAAGMSMDALRLPELRARLSEEIASQADPDVFLPRMEYDMELHPRQLSLPLVEEMSALQPCGQGNPAPIFRMRDVYVSGVRTMGKNEEHLKLQLGRDGIVRDVVAFRMGQRAGDMDARAFDLLLNAEKNEWNGRVSVQGMLKHIQPMSTQQNDVLSLKRASALHWERLLTRLRTLSFEAHAGAVLEEAQLLESLRESVQGVALVCLTPESARDSADWLRAAGVRYELQIGGDAPGDARAFHCLWCAPAAGAARPRHAHIVAMDGEWAAPLLPWEGVSAFARASQPPRPMERQEMGEIYRALPVHGLWESWDSMCAALYRGVPLERLWIGLHILRELGLVDWNESTRIELTRLPAPGRKRAIQESAIYQTLQKIADEEDTKHAGSRSEAVYTQYTGLSATGDTV